MNDFEEEDALDDFVIEIIDLDADHKQDRASVFWLISQGILSQARHWMAILTVAAMMILILTLSPTSVLRYSQGPQKAPGRTSGHTLPQTITCISSSVIILLGTPSDNGTGTWSKLPVEVWSKTSNILPFKPIQGALNCDGLHSIVILRGASK